MCQSIPCAGCRICYTELCTLVARNRRWKGPYTDPFASKFGFYIVKSCGYNEKGNYHESRLYGSDYPNDSPYYYHNLNDSKYWSNPDGSTVYDNGRGFQRCTAPEGDAPPTPPPSPPRRYHAIPVRELVEDDNGMLHVRTAHLPDDDETGMKVEDSDDDDDEPMPPAQGVRTSYRTQSSILKGKWRAPAAGTGSNTRSPQHGLGSSTTVQPTASTSGTREQAHHFTDARICHCGAAKSTAPPDRTSGPSSHGRAVHVSAQHSSAQRSTRDIGVGNDLDILTDRLSAAVRLSDEPNPQSDAANLAPIKLTGTVRNAQEMGEDRDPSGNGGAINDPSVQRKRVKKVSIIPPVNQEHTFHQTPPPTHAERTIVTNSRTRRARGPEFPLEERVTEMYEGVTDWIKRNPNSNIRLGGDGSGSQSEPINKYVERSSTWEMGNRQWKISLGSQFKVEEINK